MTTAPWQSALEQKEKCVLFSYVYLAGKDQTNRFSYMNDGQEREQVVIVILDEIGHPPAGTAPTTRLLAPSESVYIDARELLNNFEIETFRGGILMIVSNVEPGKPFIWGAKDLISFWHNAHSSTQIGTSGFVKLNIPSELKTKSFYLFCPAVVSTGEVKTLISLFHFSTEPGYTEVATLVPRLHNLNGETIEGKPFSIGPYGTGSLDVDEWFGQAGQELLKKTGGRGSLTCAHPGHTLGTYFFHVRRADGGILSGQHTQPPVPCLFYYKTSFNYWANYIGSKLPFAGHIVPIISYLKHNPGALTILYPHHSNYLNSFWDWLKQSRFVIWFRFVCRAFYFLLKRKLVIEEISMTERDHHNYHVIQHNLWNNFKLFQFSRGRIESLLYPLRSIGTVKPAGKTLCIGPKNEGELLLLSAHGFTDVVGIDLFTYSPKILLMDVHRMTFLDNTFDTIFCGWVVSYFYDLPKAVAEIIRVAKDGALLIFSFGVNLDGSEDLGFINTHLFGGVKELLAAFGVHVGHVYWWSEDVVGGKTRVNKVIFTLRKGDTAPEASNAAQMNSRM